MATWQRIATTADLVAERTKSFDLWAATKYGINQRGVSFPYLHGKDPSDQTSMPMIDWSATSHTGSDTGHISNWRGGNASTTNGAGTDETGIDTTGAYFDLFGDQSYVTNEPTTTGDQANFMTEGVMGQMLPVPSGSTYHNGVYQSYGKHKINVSGVISNHHSANDSYSSYLHMQIWRAYAAPTLTIGDDASIDDSLRFRLVRSSMHCQNSHIQPPSKKDSSRFFKMDEEVVLIDPDHCTNDDKMCYYLISCWVGRYNYNGYYNETGSLNRVRQWPYIASTSSHTGSIGPYEGSTRESSLKLNVEITYKPWTPTP
tara:strand:- start:636 stop:1580 length:945 start_codon:yes stop_codon:yes gene_type:complete